MPTYLTPGVYVEEVDSGSRPIEGVGTAVAAFVGFAANGPYNTPTLVSNWTQYSKAFGEFVEDYYLPQSVYGYFLNGGGNCFVVRIPGPNDSDLAGSGNPTTTPEAVGGSQTAALSGPATGQLGGYIITAKETGPGKPGTAGGGELSVEIVHPSGSNGGDDRFDLVVKSAGTEAERFPGVTAKKGKDNVVTVVRERSKLIVLDEASGPVTSRPAKGEVALVAPAAAGTSLVSAAGAPSGSRGVAAADYIGDVSRRTGFGGLEAVDEVTMVAVPDLMSAYQRGLIDEESMRSVQAAIIAHCELMGDRMAILDSPPAMNPQEIQNWRVNTAGYDSKYAALYYPWVKVLDPASGKNVFVPPSGYLAGVWARNDGTRGVHKAPANEVIQGVIDLQTGLTNKEQELLNPNGVNCIRAFPGRGIRVWGARTLSSDPAWRYLNVRRLFNYLEKSILGGTQWVVFEPNDPALWAKIRRTISAFLVMEWRKGALFGLSPDESYYVKCDSETNPAEAIDAGQVTCQIGVAPVKPAEFVIFQLAQFSGGVSLVSE